MIDRAMLYFEVTFSSTVAVVDLKFHNIFTQQRSRRPCLRSIRIMGHDPVGVDVNAETFRK